MTQDRASSDSLGLRDAKIAIVHDALVARGGAERVVVALAQLFPRAPIYTSVYKPESTYAEFGGRDIRTSFLQRFCTNPTLFRAALPFYPAAFEAFDFSRYDVVVSSSAHWAKGVVVSPSTLHISYCHSPSRIAWNTANYLERERLGPIARVGVVGYSHLFRLWDVATATRVDSFVANSQGTAARIRKFYRRRAQVLAPPVDCDRFSAGSGVGDFFLVVARLNAYKRVDLTVQAFNELGLKLLVVGDGPMRRRLERGAASNITFVGAVPEEELPRYYSRCRALIVACEEDFGLASLEAQASGRPVVAYARGGSLETVSDGETGVLFGEQSVAALKAAILSCANTFFDPGVLRQRSFPFDVSNFKRRFLEIVERQSAVHRRSWHGQPD